MWVSVRAGIMGRARVGVQRMSLYLGFTWRVKFEVTGGINVMFCEEDKCEGKCQGWDYKGGLVSGSGCRE